MGLRDAWESEAAYWLAWARTPGHDSYWTFHRDAFLELLPAPRGITLDIGCGEGRLPRDLKTHGYEVMGIDASPTLIEHARQADPGGDYQVADAAALPMPDGSVNLVTAFMTLHDVDDLGGAVHEIARVMRPDATLAIAVSPDQLGRRLRVIGSRRRVPHRYLPRRVELRRCRRARWTPHALRWPAPPAGDILRHAKRRGPRRGPPGRGSRPYGAARQPVAAPAALPPSPCAPEYGTGDVMLRRAVEAW